MLRNKFLTAAAFFLPKYFNLSTEKAKPSRTFCTGGFIHRFIASAELPFLKFRASSCFCGAAFRPCEQHLNKADNKADGGGGNPAHTNGVEGKHPAYCFDCGVKSRDSAYSYKVAYCRNAGKSDCPDKNALSV